MRSWCPRSVQTRSLRGRVRDSLFSAVFQVRARSLGANLGAGEAAKMQVISGILSEHKGAGLLNNETFTGGIAGPLFEKVSSRLQYPKLFRRAQSIDSATLHLPSQSAPQPSQNAWTVQALVPLSTVRFAPVMSAFSIVETVCRNVKRWRAGDNIERLGGIGPAGGRTPVPQSARLSRDPGPAEGAGEYGF